MRQEDVAARARISVRRYAALEHGNFTPDDVLLERVAVALLMTDAERTALWILATGYEPAEQGGGRNRVPAGHDDAAERVIVTALQPCPAAVLDETWTARFWNQALDDWSGGWFSARPHPNLVCYLLSGHARDTLRGLHALRRSAVAGLRYQMARTSSAPGWDGVLSCLTSTPAGAALWDEHELAFPVTELHCQYMRPGGEITGAYMFLSASRPDVWLYALIPEPANSPDPRDS